MRFSKRLGLSRAGRTAWLIDGKTDNLLTKLLRARDERAVWLLHNGLTRLFIILHLSHDCVRDVVFVDIADY